MEAFRLFDQEDKGFITVEDMNSKFMELELKVEAAKIFTRFDRDGDGRLDYKEFSKLVTPLGLEYLNTR